MINVMVRQQNSPNYFLIAQEGIRAFFMSRLSVRLLLTVVAVSSLLCLSVAPLTAPAFADSQARVVRLSEVQGEVQVDRNTGRGFEKTFLNLPHHARPQVADQA
jgi:hypothetical protein